MKIFVSILILFCVVNLNSEIVTLHIIHTNDIHGYIQEMEAYWINPEFPPIMGGGGSASKVIQDIRKMAKNNDEELYLLDAGDFFSGTPIGNKTKGKAIIEYMNQVEYDCMTIGNHEFDEGIDAFWDLIEIANFPVLGCNVVYNTDDEKKGKIIDGLKPYIIKEYSGIRIGILGLTTTDTKFMSMPENIEGMDFLDEQSSAEKYIKILKEEENVDLIFGLFHIGLPYDSETGYKNLKNKTYLAEDNMYDLNAMELSNLVAGLDVLIAGHIHVGYKEPWVDPINHTVIFQTYGKGSSIGYLRLKLDTETKTLVDYELPSYDDGSLITLWQDEFEVENSISDFIAKEVEKAEEGYDDVIAFVKEGLTTGGPASSMGLIVCDAMRKATNADFAFQNLGGIRKGLKAGAVTYRDLFQVLPFGNSITTIQMTGQEILQIIETRVSGMRSGIYISGGKVLYSKDLPSYKRIIEFSLNDKEFDPEKTYSVATSTFLAAGNAGLVLLGEISNDRKYDTSIIIRKALSNYLSEEKEFKFEYDERWIKKE